ncbi:hypothetical protein M758_2G159300 [Ceratodon purpureus]|nr:hypothetical protein M758_2G159300 [Ceratodon purpureus]
MKLAFSPRYMQTPPLHSTPLHYSGHANHSPPDPQTESNQNSHTMQILRHDHAQCNLNTTTAHAPRAPKHSEIDNIGTNCKPAPPDGPKALPPRTLTTTSTPGLALALTRHPRTKRATREEHSSKSTAPMRYVT